MTADTIPASFGLPSHPHVISNLIGTALQIPGHEINSSRLWQNPVKPQTVLAGPDF